MAEQTVYVATVHLVVPPIAGNGVPIDSEAGAFDYISETLRDLFLDWGYVRVEAGAGYLKPTSVPLPYEEGDFLDGLGGEEG